MKELPALPSNHPNGCDATEVHTMDEALAELGVQFPHFEPLL